VPDTSSRAIRRRYTKSSSFYIALLFAVLGGLAIVSFSFFIKHYSSEAILYRGQELFDREVKYLNNLGRIPESDPQRLYYILPDGKTLPNDLPEPSKKLENGTLLFDLFATDQQYVGQIRILDNNKTVLIGVNTTDVSHDFYVVKFVALVSIASITCIILVAFGISIFVVNGTNKIADIAQNIMKTGDLSARIEVTSRWDDLSNVATVLNALLDRIQTLVEGVTHMSDNIAHDLRTPLTRMRNQIEDLDSDQIDEGVYHKLIEEADRILDTFNALLRVSRIEKVQQKSRFKAIDFEQIVHDLIDYIEPVIEEKQIELSVQLTSAPFYGDRDLFFQAISNILDNAIKFTPRRGKINIIVRNEDNEIIIAIENTGDHIEKDDLPKIFRRFYRTDKSRSTIGTGLGLSLAAAVVRLHDGKLWAQNTAQGVKFIISL
jgi:signal transduction histidine kinase